MRYVRYIGPAHQRQITARDWATVGIQAETTVWGPFNGFAVPLDSLTEDQIRKAIEPDPFLIITGEGEGQDAEFVPTPTQTETVTPAMLEESAKVNLNDDESRSRATSFTSDEGQEPDADRSTPRNTTGGGTSPVPATESV